MLFLYISLFHSKYKIFQTSILVLVVIDITTKQILIKNIPRELFMTKEIKKSAIYKNFLIEQFEDKTIDVSCRSEKTLAILRDISNEIGFEYSGDWNSQFFGHRLIDFLNEMESKK